MTDQRVPKGEAGDSVAPAGLTFWDSLIGQGMPQTQYLRLPVWHGEQASEGRRFVHFVDAHK
ncbi:hypothetical protein, partial [Pseudomonas carnis]|uniref:hypothetical protein n=1 Tax=Pseudomonas carnis TaxID=2487355 RepID=UPI001C6167A3